MPFISRLLPRARPGLRCPARLLRVRFQDTPGFKTHMGQSIHPLMRTSRTAARGFTLMELMVTLTIVAILAGLAVPAMSEFGVRTNVSSTTNDIVVALNLARSEAVKRGREVSLISAAGSWTGGWTVATNTGEVLTRHDGVADEYRVLGAATGAGAPADRVIFTGTGALSLATAYNFSVCRPSFAPGDAQSRRVVVAASGSIRSFRDTTSAPAGSCT